MTTPTYTPEDDLTWSGAIYGTWFGAIYGVHRVGPNAIRIGHCPETVIERLIALLTPIACPLGAAAKAAE